MATIHGQTSGTVVPQSDFSARKNENGGWTASQSFQILKGDLDNYGVKVRFPGGATLKSIDPDCDDYFAFLRLSTIQAVQTVEGGWTRITAEFVGFTDGTSTTDPPLADPIPTYAKRGVAADAPINEHPKWADLTLAHQITLGMMLRGDVIYRDDTGDGLGDGVYYAGEGGARLDAAEQIYFSSGDAFEFASRITQGRTTYKFGSYEYIHRWEDNTGVSASQMNDLGKISTPSGSPPTPGTGRDWLLVGVDEEQYGSGNFRFTNSMTYILSDEGGHDSFLQS